MEVKGRGVVFRNEDRRDYIERPDGMAAPIKKKRKSSKGGSKGGSKGKKGGGSKKKGRR